MTREEYNAELERYQQMEAKKNKLKKEKSKAHKRFYDRQGDKNPFRNTEAEDDRLLRKNPNGRYTTWSSASVEYVKKGKELLKLNEKMEQSRKRLANYKGE